ncbi:Prefoldin subunit 1 [Oopsacas minuta]|uniref:Prefoldin subunit 1 n=1 Tax=Oopsacas minuta TaxID=111878 RepID=A0AAV7K9Y9_9METZ|nr:Prefoldin subunit 1 [Oopsacas minuta]
MTDQEIRKALADHQSKVLESVQKINIAESQIENLQRVITYSELTADDLKSLPADVNVYESVGRMFYLQPVEEIQRMLVDKKTNAATKIETLQANKVRLEKGMKDSGEHFRELLEQKKSQM